MEGIGIIGFAIGVYVWITGMSTSSQVTSLTGQVTSLTVQFSQLKAEHEALKMKLKDMGVLNEEKGPEEE